MSGLIADSAARSWLTDRLGCSARELARLARFATMLRDENTRQNLVARGAIDNLWWRHIADSAQLLLLARELSSEQGPWLDLGTGAGFPGLIIAILAPHRVLHLVEERRRRVEWLVRAANELELRNVTVHGQPLARVETMAARVISARAFAPLSKILELAARFSTPETTWLLPKGEQARQEVEGLPKRLRGMFHVEQSATHAAAGIVVGRGVPNLGKSGDVHC